ncbi:MAG: RNA polymerase sigma factor [Gammaproteobacteria bacterium]
MTSALDLWFATEILIHEAALTRYLRRVWFKQAEIPDFRQEIYIRVYESAAKALPASPKAFLFATARNLIADHVRRERVVSIDYTQDLDSLNVLVEEISPEQRLSARQELKRLSAALDQLPDDCRSVIWLRRVEGLSQKEAAHRLGMPEGTLESHLCRGLRLLMKAVFDTGTTNDTRQSATGSGNETEHG